MQFYNFEDFLESAVDTTIKEPPTNKITPCQGEKTIVFGTLQRLPTLM
jgi:hypothetical protein